MTVINNNNVEGQIEADDWLLPRENSRCTAVVRLTSWTWGWIPAGSVQARWPSRGSGPTASCPSQRQTSRPDHLGPPGTPRCCMFLRDCLLTGIWSRWWCWSGKHSRTFGMCLAHNANQDSYRAAVKIYQIIVFAKKPQCHKKKNGCNHFNMLLLDCFVKDSNINGEFSARRNRMEQNTSTFTLYFTYNCSCCI